MNGARKEELKSTIQTQFRMISELETKLQAAEEAHKLMVTDLNIYAEREQRLRAENDRLREALVIQESGGHLESADCWCGPTVEEHPGGTLIIHNQTH